MLFSELLKLAELRPIRAGGDAEVDNVQVDSRRCRAGSCFVAVRGWRDDGHRHIAGAIERGASSVVCERSGAGDGASAWAETADSHDALGRVAQAMRGWPARKLKCVGVTGTNGKTTVVRMIHGVLTEAGLDVAVLGTIQYETGRSTTPAPNTTPDAVRLAELMAEMVEAGKTHLVMEVSSHALDQRRTAGVEFDAAVFTNLSGDHLDYHGDMESYLAAKLRLFEGLGPDKWAILNRDDPLAERFAQATSAPKIWYGLIAAADVSATIQGIDTDGCRFLLNCDGRAVPVATGMIGRHNVQNCLAAAAACLAMGAEPATIAEALGRVRCVPGRLQRVDVDAPYKVFVDYAHTDDALHNVLGSLRPIVAGRILLVFGCGGDRDRTKRPRMARTAEQFADRIVITSDNPRSEDPEAIIAEIVAGLSAAGRAKLETQIDRHAAIECAIAQARAGDVVLIAGKGHETYQLIGERRLDFDDVQVTRRIVQTRETRR